MRILLDHVGPLTDAYVRVRWSETAVREPESWSPTLRTTVDMMLRSKFPKTLLWGPAWSNAGHPPPVLIEADGAARLLMTDPDLLLGPAADGSRSRRTAYDVGGPPVSRPAAAAPAARSR